jgi:hypothetical protein
MYRFVLDFCVTAAVSAYVRTNDAQMTQLTLSVDPHDRKHGHQDPRGYVSMGTVAVVTRTDCRRKKNRSYLQQELIERSALEALMCIGIVIASRSLLLRGHGAHALQYHCCECACSEGGRSFQIR